MARFEKTAMDAALNNLRQALIFATRGMSVDDLARRPAEGKWCAAEILEHLCLTYSGTAKGMGRCLDAGKPLATSPTFKQRMMAAVVIGFGHMPSGRQSPKAVYPRGMPAPEAVAQMEARMTAMEEAIARCEARYGAGVKLLDHPILGPLTGREWRKFHCVHGHHHLRQIDRLRVART